MWHCTHSYNVRLHLHVKSGGGVSEGCTVVQVFLYVSEGCTVVQVFLYGLVCTWSCKHALVCVAVFKYHRYLYMYADTVFIHFIYSWTTTDKWKQCVYLSHTYWVKHVWLAELCLEVGWTSQDQAWDVGFVVGDEQLDCHFCHFAYIVVSLLHAQSSKTQCRLTSSAWSHKQCPVWA